MVSPRRHAVGSDALWVGALATVLLATVLVTATVGSVDVPARTVVLVVLDALPAVSVHVAAPEKIRFIVLDIRLPRILLGAAVGFALATAGTVMQGLFRNSMADPFVVGVSSGGAVGAVAFIVAPLALPFGLPLAAFAGAVATAFLVYLIATRGGRTPVATLLLAGVAVQTFLGAVVSLLLVTSGNGLRTAVFWLMGHLSGATWARVGVVLLPSLLCFGVLYAHAPDLNLLLLGEADAHALGVSVERTKRLLLAVSAVATGAAVAVSGVIGFVGLVVPHAMRLLVGPDHRVLLPTSALAGAAFLVLTDTLARQGATELPVGIVTAFLGAPFFLYLLRRREVADL